MDFFNAKKQIDKKLEPAVPDGHIVEDVNQVEVVPVYVAEMKPFREFSTGASRNLDHGKHDLTGFLSVPALRAFADYMHRKRQMPDGSVRDGDNWQKGMPRKEFLRSLERHVFDLKAHLTGNEKFAMTDEPVLDALCAIMFNAQGLLHEIQINRDLQS